MSLDKAVKHGKERRKGWYGSQAFDPTCRCNGRCAWCRQNRTHAVTVARQSAQEQIRDFAKEPA